MKKFFLFRREAVSVTSVAASDTGKDLSVLAVPADSLAFATAETGKVILSFNSASKYEESNLTDGESIEKTTVSVPCQGGLEFDLIESILTFISKQGGRSVMKFDFFEGVGTFNEVSYDSVLNNQLHINPTKRVTGEASTQTFIGTSGAVGAVVASTSTGGIDFGIIENQPTIDYSHVNLSSFSADDEVAAGSSTKWANSGTGGATYDIVSNVGAPVKKTGGLDAKDAISKDYVEIDASDHFIVPTFRASGDYTLFVAFSNDPISGVANITPIYGSSTTETFGPFIGEFKDGASAGVVGTMRTDHDSIFAVRHEDILGKPAYASTGSSSDGTVAYNFPGLTYLGALPRSNNLHVFVVRRDTDGNLYMYNSDGDLVAFNAAFTPTSQKTATVENGYLAFVSSSLQKLTPDSDGRTDGDLVIERLGTTGDLTTGSFLGNLARFGVIERDIGAASCSKLATDLFNLYKP